MRGLFLSYIHVFLRLHCKIEKMARTKKAPQRVASSSLIEKADAAVHELVRHSNEQTNGAEARNGLTKGSPAKSSVPEVQKEAGALQFLVAVGGIYGSLFVLTPTVLPATNGITV